MKKKNGFTLIELLAVIVILAIIALIATPIILNLLERARKGAAQSSAYGIREAAKEYYSSSLIDYPEGSNKNIIIEFTSSKQEPTITNGFDGLKFEIDGTKPSSGQITISSTGEVRGNVKINGYDCNIENSGTIKCNKGKTEDDKSDEGGPTTVASSANDMFKAIAYLDPTDLTRTCNADNSSVGGRTQNGCMKWYVFKEDGQNYTMILDHNTTADKDGWNSMQGMDECHSTDSSKAELDKLVNDINWKVTPRLMSVEELTNIIVDNNGHFGFPEGNSDASDFIKNGGYFFSEKNNQLYWLIDYVGTCDSLFTCKVGDESVTGYLLSGTDGTYWSILADSLLGKTCDSGAMIRPVITVPKTIFK